MPKPSSMTGYARLEGAEGGAAWTWEVRSVNGRSLDMRCRLAPGHENLDGEVRRRIQAKAARGNFQVSLNLRRQGAEGAEPRINHAWLVELARVARAAAGELSLPEPRLDSLLLVKGVVELAEVEEDEETRRQRDRALLADFDRTLGDCLAARAGEGARIGEVVAAQLEELRATAAAARDAAAAQPALAKARLEQLLADLLPGGAIAEERIAQEAAVIAGKSDVREELDRLEAHLQAAGELLAEGKAIGRRLDFLCQELNREANTLCSKSADLALTRLGLALKATIEQFREQIQNLE